MELPVILPNRDPLASATEVKRPYRPTGHGKETMPVIAEHFDFAKARPETIACQCLDGEINKAAAEVAELAHRNGADSKPQDVAVYVISPEDEDVVKVGMAKRPQNRLASLQVSNWKPLTIEALFWCLNWQDAERLEFETHKAMRAAGHGARGEWFTTGPLFAAIAVATVAHSLKIKVADSAMWLRQRQAIRRQVFYLEHGRELPANDFIGGEKAA